MIYLQKDDFQEATILVPLAVGLNEDDVFTLREAVGSAIVATITDMRQRGDYAYITIAEDIAPGEYYYTISDGFAIKAEGLLRVVGEELEYEENENGINYTEYGN